MAKSDKKDKKPEVPAKVTKVEKAEEKKKKAVVVKKVLSYVRLPSLFVMRLFFVESQRAFHFLGMPLSA